MKKTKLLKPILASLIIESLLIAPLAAAENSCKPNQSAIDVLSRLNDLNRPVTEAQTGLDSRLKDVKTMEEFKARMKQLDKLTNKVFNKVNSLPSMDSKEQERNKELVKNNVEQKINRPKIPINIY